MDTRTQTHALARRASLVGSPLLGPSHCGTLESISDAAYWSRSRSRRQLAARRPALRAATALETADYCDFGSDLHRHALICSAALRLGFWTIFRASLSLVATYSRWFRLDLSLSLLALGGAFFFCCSPFRSIFSLALGQTRSWTIPILNSRKKVKTTKAQKHCRLL